MSRDKCLDCGANRGIIHNAKGDYCFSCHLFTSKNNELVKATKKLLLRPWDKTEDIPKEGLEWLKKYHLIDKEQFKKYNITWSHFYKRLVFSYDKHLSGFDWMRDVSDNTKNKWLMSGKKDLYYLCKDLLTNTRSLVIVEDVVSAIRISKFCDVVALGGTNYSSLKAMLVPLFLKYKNIIIWLDSDVAGKRASNQFIKDYKMYRDVLQRFTNKDPKCYSDKELSIMLEDVL